MNKTSSIRYPLTHFAELEGRVELVSGGQEQDGVVDARVQRGLRLEALFKPERRRNDNITGLLPNRCVSAFPVSLNNFTGGLPRLLETLQVMEKKNKTKQLQPILSWDQQDG